MVRWSGLLLFVGTLAHANGVNTHAWIGLRAVEALPPGTLRTLLEKPELYDAFVNGTVFPDGGYAVKDNYGETAHWEPFVDGYVKWIRAHYQPPYQGEGARHVAFLMGVAAHGMADQVFDSMFFQKGEREDAAGWSEELLDGFDTATDVFLVESTGQRLKFDPWYPPQIVDIFKAGTGYDAPPGAIENGQFLITHVVLDYAQTAVGMPDKLAGYHQRYPWAAAHLMEPREPGSPPVEARAVSAYLRALWDRLHGELRQENVVIATEPSDGAAGVETDHTRLESHLIVIFGHHMDHATLTGVTVVDTMGHHHNVNVGYVWGSADANVAILTPVEDWPADEDLTVAIPPGVRSFDGLQLQAPFSFRFSTRAASAADPLPGADPTPRSGDPAGSAVSAGGCDVSGGPPTSALVLGLLLTGLALRRAPHTQKGAHHHTDGEAA